MYKFKKEYKKEFLTGHTIGYIIERLELCYGNVLDILNGKKACKKAYCYAIFRLLGHTDRKFDKYFEKME